VREQAGAYVLYCRVLCEYWSIRCLCEDRERSWEVGDRPNACKCPCTARQLRVPLSSPSSETLLAGCGDAETREPDRVPTEGSAGVCGFEEEPRGL
jgi:hypothetical protein